MKILFYGLNSKFIHTMPSGWFLSEYLNKKGIFVKEIYRNVNEDLSVLIDELLKMDFDILLLSVYIFNANKIKKIIDAVRQSKSVKIIIGGPEADDSFNADHVVIGEGEEALYRLLIQGGEKKVNEIKIITLDDIPSPYTEERLDQSKNKLIYYESSRGCPFSCAYCMAGGSKGVRYFSLERVKSDLEKIVNSGAKIIKFTDRTFNAHTERCEEILNFILENFKDNNVCFHFEVGGDLFRESTINLLKKFPLGRVQLEAGVQTLNGKSLSAVNRVFNWEKFYDNMEKIISAGNVHTHLDLIAGLPFETLETFAYAFDEVIKLRPHMLQLGFLKMLKGAPIRDIYKADYSSEPPYEIISSDLMSKQELDLLRDIEWVVDKIYNSGKFFFTLEKLLKLYSPFTLFKTLALCFKNCGKRIPLYKFIEVLLNFMRSIPFSKEILRFDYFVSARNLTCPKFLRRNYSLSFRNFIKTVNTDDCVKYEEFSYNPNTNEEGIFIVKFDYRHKNPVNGRYNFTVL